MSRFIFLVPLFCVLALAGEPREGVENPEPPSVPKAETNQPPVKLQSANGHPVLPPKPAAPAPPPRPIALIVRDVVVIDTPGQEIIVVPERYLHDLTNIYHFRVLPKVALPEP